MARSIIVKTTSRSWVSVLDTLDPGWREEGNNPVEYEFSNGREFSGREKSRGAYA